MQAKIVSPPPEAEYYFSERCYILEAWNTSQDEAVSIARARVEPGVTTRVHYLEGVQERYLIVSGTGLVHVGELAPTEVAPGDVVVIPAGTRQYIRNTGETDLVFYAICTPRFTSVCYHDLDE